MAIPIGVPKRHGSSNAAVVSTCSAYIIPTCAAASGRAAMILDGRRVGGGFWIRADESPSGGGASGCRVRRRHPLERRRISHEARSVLDKALRYARTHLPTTASLSRARQAM